MGRRPSNEKAAIALEPMLDRDDPPARTRDVRLLPGEAADITLGVGLARAKDHGAIRTLGALSEVGA